MFQYLPEELQLLILAKMLYSIKSFLVLDTVYRQHNTPQLATNRIILWWKIMSRYRRMRAYIYRKLKSISRGYYHVNNNCIYYAPYVPYGMCRLCSNYRQHHIFSTRLIENFYLPV